MANYSTILFDVREHVAHITLNRPEAANGINIEMASELRHAARRCAADADVRAVLLAGNGKMFCAGGDLKAFAAQPEGELPSFLEQVTLHLHQAIAHFTRMNAPVVAAVHGSAAGGGLSFACACDFPIAAESAKFTMAYTRAGLTPDGSSTYFLPRIIGYRRTLELAITNRVLSAREACELGLVYRVVPDADLLSEASKFATQLAAGATAAFGGVKRLLVESFTNTLEAQMSLETDYISAAGR
ncbi:MAG TPA: enoyl-CoA hydratase/isomerase family protein, partial [Candidatus Acidoferrales bacterium]|nr:enoyl-CoA hydratase/isomerase family protein [Candidatus Acidoferrales bacterium]